MKKDKSDPKETPVDGFKVTMLLLDHHGGRDLIQVSFLEHLTQMATKSRAGLCEYNRGMSPVQWAVVRGCHCLVALVPKHTWEPAIAHRGQREL